MKNCDFKPYSRGEPLCVFCLSPPFFIRGLSAEKRPSAPSRRQEFPFSTSSFAGLQFSRLSRKKSYTNLLLTIADLFGNFKRRKSLNLEEILSTVQKVWQGPESSYRSSEADMERISKKGSVQEVRHPSPQRRRLSVPETIMRKHNLAQEYSSSQESKQYHWSNETQCSSDPNLSKKRDFNVIRKSTLLRRLWGDNSKPKLAGSFQEWQHSSKKISSTQSLNSNNSSPERIPRGLRETSLTLKKLSSSPKRFSSKNESLSNSPKRKLPVIENESLKVLSKTPLSRESTTKYTYSSFTNFSETNSDSAYTNSISGSTNPLSSVSNLHEDENRNRTEADSRLPPVTLQESAVQTRDVANLNVISNVSLSQSTLDVIFNEVMKDVNKLTPGDINISSARVTCDNKNKFTVETVPGISLDTNSNCTLSSNQSNLEQFILSTVRTGSPYGKPKENDLPVVARFSAVPRTSSMEVNTSEEDKYESDTASFVDSLEDNSPRPLAQSRKSSSDISQLLPEGKKDSSPKKSSTFFIPIEVEKDTEIKAVSELLPIKVREKLLERQHKREEKTRQFKSALKTTDNVSEIKNNLSLRNYLPKKRSKPVLPSIESLKKLSREKKIDSSKAASASSTMKKSSRSSSTHKSKEPNKQGNESDKKEEFTMQPRKVYHRTTYENAHKRIEILEIMECIEMPSVKNPKSKIPVLISSNTNKKPHFDKPVYLDLDNHVPDNKFDQLIANILIDSLNHDLEVSNYDSNEKNANLPESELAKNQEYLQKFDAIPEEVPSLRRPPEERNNNNSHNIPGDQNDKPTRSIKNKNLERKDSSIPNGWVSVYSVRQESRTPDSTSDEGKKYFGSNNVRELTHGNLNSREATHENHLSPKNNISDESKPDLINDNFSSSDENSTFESTLLHRPLEKFGNHQRRAKMRKESNQTNIKGDWSVTVSGTNRYNQIAPDVEMRLSFPNKTVSDNQNYSDNGQGRKNSESRLNFPKLESDVSSRSQRILQKTNRRHRLDDNLPRIQTVQTRKKIDGSAISMTPSIIIPKQTKTSRNRYHLSRPRERFSLPDVPSMLNERQYYEILRRIPNILAVTGRTMNSEGKSVEER